MNSSSGTAMKTAPWPLDSACSDTKPAARRRSRLRPLVDVGMQRGEPERDPLHVRQVDLADAEEPRWSALEDDSANDGSGHAQPEAAGQDVSAEAAEHARQQ